MNDLIKYLNNLYSIHQYKDYGPNGLQVDAGAAGELKKIAFAVTASLESITAAAAWGADLLITHHGILWDHQGARAIVGPYGERIKLLIKSEMSLVSYHLPMDGHPTLGHGAVLAKKLNINNTQPLMDPKKNLLGVWGELDQPITAIELQRQLAVLLKRPVAAAVFDNASLIKRIGIITGGGQALWAIAKQNDCHAYITGEITEYNYHDCREAEIHYFAGGHHATEVWGLYALEEHLEENFPGKYEMKFFDSGNPA
jgi:dinuclear metal center YbgI/SA1388 family protein